MLGTLSLQHLRKLKTAEEEERVRRKGGRRKRIERIRTRSGLEDISFKDLRVLEGLRTPHPKPFSSLGPEALLQLDLQFQELVLAFVNVHPTSMRT